MKPIVYPVKIRVRSRSRETLALAGEVWTRNWRDFDAYQPHVEDLMKPDAAINLCVEWPKDFVGPNGQVPGAPTNDDTMQPATADGIANARQEAKRFYEISLAAERELSVFKATHGAELSEAQSARDAAMRRVSVLEQQVLSANLERGTTLEELSNLKANIVDRDAATQAAHASAIDALNIAHKGEMTVVKAEAQRMIDEAMAEVEKAQAQIAKLEAAKAPAPAAPKPPPPKTA